MIDMRYFQLSGEIQAKIFLVNFLNYATHFFVTQLCQIVQLDCNNFNTLVTESSVKNVQSFQIRATFSAGRINVRGQV